MSKTIKVFVSSTFNDLQHHRARIIRQLRDAGFHVDPMEEWPADATEPTKFCSERVRECDLCVLIVGFRRGWVPDPMGANRSITQMEYDEAIRLGVDVLVLFLADDVKNWPTDFDERTDDQLKAWRAGLQSQAGNERFHFKKDPDSVIAPLAAAVARWQQRQKERERLTDYLKCVANAHKTINFLGLPTFKENPDVEIEQLFVEPALTATEASPDRDPKDWGEATPLLEAVTQRPMLIVLGDPGTGKSTLVNWVVYQLARPEPNAWKVRLGTPIPLPFVLRDLGIGRGVTWDDLLDKFLAHAAHHNLTREQLEQLAKDGSAMFLLDGLDEIGDVRTREDLRAAVHEGQGRYPGCRWLLTSRIVGYEDVPFQIRLWTLDLTRATPEFLRPSVTAYVAPFDAPQIEEFAGKWYAIRETDPFKVQRAAAGLVDAIHRDPDTLRLGRVPNLLTMMALVQRNRRVLPDGKAILYDWVADAYLETIDFNRNLPTGPDSLRDKKRWLGRVAFEMQRRRAAAASADEHANAIVADGDMLLGWLGAAMSESGTRGDPDDPARFLDRVRKRSGLMIERSPGRFAFTHLSFQEYFAAVYLQEWVTSAEWLTGEEVAPGTSADDLRTYVNQTAWQVTLVFLFELIADNKALGKKKVRHAVFGPDWGAIELGTERSATAAVLLAKLADNPHVGWDEATRASAYTRGLDWTVSVAEIKHVDNEVLRVYLGGEPETAHPRLGILGTHWARARCPSLNLADTSVADLGPLALLSELRRLSLRSTKVLNLQPLSGLCSLQILNLGATRVQDLTPIAALRKLRGLYLTATQVRDVGPLSNLTKLRILDLTRTKVVDLRPLSNLTLLAVLDLSETDVTDLTPLAGLTELRTLILLHNTKLDNLRPLSGLTGLQTLAIDASGVPEAEIELLQTKLPHLQIALATVEPPHAFPVPS